MTESLFLKRSKTRKAVLVFLFAHPAEAFYLRELSRHVRFPVGNVRRELLKLEREGLVHTSRQANLLYFRLNQEHLLYPELFAIMQKTFKFECGKQDRSVGTERDKSHDEHALSAVT
ncbi:MAG: archaellum operon transcriptional activator EarA family protein [Candidatus Omnitrophica bacterium]|nr:archaellum operon transcriptional activator EarA family protein [Candidatus Omnitrophota bacterium]